MIQRTSCASEVRSYLAERDVGEVLHYRDIAKQLGEEPMSVCATMSKLAKLKFVEKAKKRGTFKITARSRIAKSSFTPKARPAPHTKGARKKMVVEVITPSTVMSKASKIKEQLLELAVQVEDLEKVSKEVDLSSVSWENLVKEVIRRKSVAKQQIDPKWFK